MGVVSRVFEWKPTSDIGKLNNWLSLGGGLASTGLVIEFGLLFSWEEEGNTLFSLLSKFGLMGFPQELAEFVLLKDSNFSLGRLEF